MKVDINPRGNGACPLCIHAASCRIKRQLVGSIDDIHDTDDTALEIVIYSCPQFKEKD